MTKLNPWHYPDFWSALQTQLHDREEIYKRRDGNDFWAQVSSSSVRGEDGTFLYAVRVQQDITDRKHAEQQLARRMEQQAALYQLTEQLQSAHSFEAVYEFALAAIQRALNCQRAAILLFDAAGVNAVRRLAWPLGRLLAPLSMCTFAMVSR